MCCSWRCLEAHTYHGTGILPSDEASCTAAELRSSASSEWCFEKMQCQAATTALQKYDLQNSRWPGQLLLDCTNMQPLASCSWQGAQALLKRWPMATRVVYAAYVLCSFDRSAAGSSEMRVQAAKTQLQLRRAGQPSWLHGMQCICKAIFLQSKNNRIQLLTLQPSS
jgi:hypothetical protein